jgi:hypothetical protein
MAGGTTSPPIFRAAIRMLVPGSTSTVMLSIVILNSFFSSVILAPCPPVGELRFEKLYLNSSVYSKMFSLAFIQRHYYYHF